MSRIVSYLMAGASAVVIFPALCHAQFGGIAGVVRDSTGAVIPGVSVAAASPTLIEKNRTAVSDEAGQYRVEQLRPGVYTVTFMLPGFRIVRREGIEISAGFTAPVNASLEVGAAGETINVSVQAPVVDVQTVSQQRTLVKQELDALPTARSFATLGTTLPSVSANQRDVGGTQGERGNVLAAHGGSGADMTLQIDGITIGNQANGQAWTNFSLNDAAVQEMSFVTNAISAEAAGGGVRVNAIPREGGNAFHGTAFYDFANRSMSRSNLTDTERAQGLTVVPGFSKLYDESAGVGGPIKRDRVWFYYAQRYRSNDVAGVNTFFSFSPLSVNYNPDLTRPVHSGGFDGDNQLRLTTQLTPRNKMSFFFDKVNKCNCPTIVDAPIFTAEASSRLTYPGAFGTWLGSISWQATIRPKLLWDSAVSYNSQRTAFTPLAPTVSATGPISVTEIGPLGVHILRAPTPGVFTGGNDERNVQTRGGLSYVTGRHSVTVGFTYHYGHSRGYVNETSNDVSYTTVFGSPTSATYYAAPYVTLRNVPAELGLYAQDKWTLHRLTLTGGIRWDYFKGEIPAQSVPANALLPARNFAAVSDVPNWKDISPRLGASYDLFGNGKTAIKVGVNRYVSAQVYAFAGAVNPITAGGGNQVTRAITNPLVNINLAPKGDPTNPNANGDLGPGPANFGQSFVSTTYDPNLSQGWGKRPYNWEYSAAVQHELVPRVSLEVGYFRRTFGNQTVTDNRDITPSDFDKFCITTPTDPHLGSASGRQLCGLADINPAKASLTTHQVITFANNFRGETSQTYNGFDFNVNARPTGRFFLLAGLSIGRTITKTCAVVDNPQTLLFCESHPPFQGSYRVSGGYTFPWKLQLSGVYQSIPPDSFQPTYTVTNAAALPSLGRSITAGSISNVPVVAPYTFFTDRVNQVDLRVTKAIQMEKYRIELMADLYNVLNTSPVLTRNAAVGAGFYAPTTILQSAYLKLGARFTF
jgi:Carboxypeptidase regulatory-like domain